jgi:hypothetical protein
MAWLGLLERVLGHHCRGDVANLNDGVLCRLNSAAGIAEDGCHTYGYIVAIRQNSGGGANNIRDS